MVSCGKASSIVDVAEVATDVSEHQADLVGEQNAWRPTDDRQDSILAQQAEAVAVERCGPHRLHAGHLQRRDLFAQIGRGDAGKGQEQDSLAGHPFFEEPDDTPHQSKASLPGAWPSKHADPTVGRASNLPVCPCDAIVPDHHAASRGPSRTGSVRSWLTKPETTNFGSPSISICG